MYIEYRNAMTFPVELIACVWDIFGLDAIIRSGSRMSSRENKRQLHASANKVNESYCDVFRQRDLSIIGSVEKEYRQEEERCSLSLFFYLFQELIV
jgi:hypothetical protein